MALDTALKRASSVSFGGFTVALRVPDATDMDEVGDRANETFSYAGFSSSGTGLFGDRRRRAMAVLD